MWPSSCYKIARSRAHVQSLISMIAWPIWTIIILHLSIVLNATDFELDLNQNQYPDHEYVGKSFLLLFGFCLKLRMDWIMDQVLCALFFLVWMDLLIKQKQLFVLELRNVL